MHQEEAFDSYGIGYLFPTVVSCGCKLLRKYVRFSIYVLIIKKDLGDMIIPYCSSELLYTVDYCLR